MKRSSALSGLVLSLVAFTASAAEIRAYGPGGPMPAMKEAAAKFQQVTGNKVEVTAGPTPNWIEGARADADLMFSGSETMMTDFVAAMNGQIKSEDVEPLYLRASAILVRPGNPKKIGSFADLLKSDMKVMVVQGAGQTGMWEDIAGRKGDIETVKQLRKNIGTFAPNSAAAKEAWSKDESFDAWIIWTIWQKADPKLADVVEIEHELRVYRDTGVVPTERGKAKPEVASFIGFLEGNEGREIFKNWGWITDRP